MSSQTHLFCNFSCADKIQLSSPCFKKNKKATPNWILYPSSNKQIERVAENMYLLTDVIIWNAYTNTSYPRRVRY